MKAFSLSAMPRNGTHTVTWLAAFALLAVGGCAELTDLEPELVEPTDLSAPRQLVYSLSTYAEDEFMIAAAEDGVSGPRWCRSGTAQWFETATQSCGGRAQHGDMGEITYADGEMRIAVGRSYGAPFLWTGGPERLNPFPDDGDFAADIRVTVEQLAMNGMGIWLLDWDPATTEGVNSPLVAPVLRIWADRSGLKATLLGTPVTVSDPYQPHWFRVDYADGAYTMFIDGVSVAGPLASERRPSAAWLGNPTFAPQSANDWSDFRLSEMTVTSPALEAEVVEVAVEVKPGECSPPLNTRARGVLPVAIIGEDGVVDVSKIDPATIRLEGVPPIRSSLEDVGTPTDCGLGPDGVPDLTLKFDKALVVEAIGNAEDGESRTLKLTGNFHADDDVDGPPLSGQDVVVIIKR